MPPFKPTPTCRNCGKALPSPAAEGRSGAQRKFCDPKCRKQFVATAKTMTKAGLDPPPTDPNQAERMQAMTPYVRAMRQLAFNSGIEDEVRETLRDEVRGQVRQHLKDNILGGVEALTGLLPSVLTRLGDDLESEDWMRSARAQSLILKYAFAFKEADTAEGDNRTIQIFHGVPVPDTPLGDRMRTIIIESEGPDDEPVDAPVEPFESDWPVCTVCETRKHPDTFAVMTEDGTEGVCRSCHYQRTIKQQLSNKEDVIDGGAGDTSIGGYGGGKPGPLDRDM